MPAFVTSFLDFLGKFQFFSFPLGHLQVKMGCGERKSSQSNTMDQEVNLRVGDDEIRIGYVSEFLIPRDGDALRDSVFEKICEAFWSIDPSGTETKPVIISIN